MFFRLFRLDEAIFFTVLSRLTIAVFGLLSIFFIGKFLSPVFQGYFYTFFSLIALQVFVELGLNSSIAQFVSHEMAGVKWHPRGHITGAGYNKKRIQSLLIFSAKWFGMSGIMLNLILIPLGLYFFKHNDPGNYSLIEVGIPWVVLVFFTSINLIVSSIVSIIEATGRVAEFAKVRFWQSFLSNVASLSVLYLGGNLYAILANSITSAIFCVFWLVYKYRIFIYKIITLRVQNIGVDWRAELWPFQWRMSLSWISGYLVSQIFNPILFLYAGPIEAGKMGLTMQIFGVLNGVAISWLSTKTPIFGKLIAEKNYYELNSIFFSKLKISAIMLIFGNFLAYTFYIVILIINSEYLQRILPLKEIFVLSIVSIANHFLFSEAIYLRAFKEELFLKPSVFNGVITAIFALFLIPLYGTFGAVFSYAFGTIFIGLTWGTFIFIKKLKINVL